MRETIAVDGWMDGKVSLRFRFAVLGLVEEGRKERTPYSLTFLIRYLAFCTLLSLCRVVMI